MLLRGFNLCQAMTCRKKKIEVMHVRPLHRRIRVRSKFFDQVGHETMYASSGNKHFFTKFGHRQTYQTYEQSLRKLGTILENKLP